MKYLSILLILTLASCIDHKETSDEIQQQQQEKILSEGSAETGMPAIKNFRERKMLKDIMELRDQGGLTTYTYLYNEMAGKLVFLGESIGYGLPAATQFTSPEKAQRYFFPSEGEGHLTGVNVLPQADPNGLFSPSATEGTWVLLKNPNGKDVQPVYIEPRIIVSPFRLSTN